MEMACVYKSGFQAYFDASHPKLNDDDFHHNDTVKEKFFLIRNTNKKEDLLVAKEFFESHLVGSSEVSRLPRSQIVLSYIIKHCQFNIGRRGCCFYTESENTESDWYTASPYGLVDLQLPHSSDRGCHIPLSVSVTVVYPPQVVLSCTLTLRTYC